MRNVVVEEPVGPPIAAPIDSLAQPATSMCLCVPLDLGVRIISMLMLSVSAFHFGTLFEVGMFRDWLLFWPAVVLCVMELAAGIFLMAASQELDAARLGLYILFGVSGVEVIRLFLCLPLALAFYAHLTPAQMVRQVVSSVYGTAADIYFCFIVWSFIRRSMDTAHALEHHATGTLAAPRVVDANGFEMTSSVRPSGSQVDATARSVFEAPAPRQSGISEYKPPLLSS